jgi:hypothetical protein
MAKATAPKKKAAKPAVKKTATKAAKSSDNTISIKYTDKSPGQSKELTTIFEAIKKMFLPYEKGDMKLHGGTGGQVSLVNHRPVEINGRKKPEMWFAGALIQKGYVGFYFMPAYTGDKLTDLFQPELLKCLKGKSCFHIKKDDKQLYAQIKESLKLGFDAFRKRGWI